MSGSELVGLADRLRDVAEDYRFVIPQFHAQNRRKMKARADTLDSVIAELRALAARLPDGYVMAPREIVEAVLKRDGGTACGCNNVSRQADREYEMGKCPHQRLAAAMIAASPTASPEAGDPPA